MRIIGGEARGRRLFVPATFAVRPTADRIKEAFFNIIGPVDGKTFIDFFSGSGSVGIEALSRGALKAVFVENSRIPSDAVRKNLNLCGYADKSEILAEDFIKAIRRFHQRSETFDVLFADPPYDRGIVSLTLAHLGDGALMTNGGLLTIQHSVREVAAMKNSGKVVLTDRRQYGDTILSFFKKRD
jgi:16S rRNA (guanine(966)-N(2))-methyltransferase RsmD